MTGKKYMGLCAGLALLTLFTGCGKEKVEIAKAPVVKVRQVGETGGQAMAGAVYSGAVRGRYETAVAFQVGGQICAREVQEGSLVTAGQVMMRIDPKDVEQKNFAAEAQYKIARANYERFQALYEAEAVSQMARDQYRTIYEQAEAAYVQTQNAMGYTELLAPSDGVVSAVNAEIGQVVSAGSPVLTFVRNGDLEVETFIPENKLGDIAEGKKVEVTCWALGDKRMTGVIREISPVADKASRTFKVRVSLPDPPSAVRLGMTASVLVSGEKLSGAVTTLPLTAIYQTGDKPEVWVVEDNKAVRREVRIVSIGENDVKVIGLKKGDSVILAGVHKLTDNQAVRVKAEGEQ